MTTVPSPVSFWRKSGRQRPRTWHHSREIGLAKKPEPDSRLLSKLTKHLLNRVQQRICRCSRYTRTTSQCKATLSGSRATETERSMGCTSELHECGTCPSCASNSLSSYQAPHLSFSRLVLIRWIAFSKTSSARA